VIENWDLVVIDDRDVQGWAQPAEQFTQFLKALSRAVTESYGMGLAWHGPDLPDDDWLDPAQIERLFVEHRPRYEDGRLLTYVPSGVVVHGFLDRGPNTDFSDENQFVRVYGTAAGESDECGDGGLSINAVFAARKGAMPLNEHRMEWLIGLLCSVGAAVTATRGRITTDGYLDATVDADVTGTITVGGLTLAPRGVDLEPWPSSLTPYPCPVGYPDGQVIVADLGLLVNDPGSLIPDLLSLNAALAPDDSN
jgi:hypothetical protein